MYIIARVERRTETSAVVSECDMSTCSRVSVQLCDTEVKHEQRVAPLSNTHCKIVRLDIPNDDTAGVSELDSVQLQRERWFRKWTKGTTQAHTI